MSRNRRRVCLVSPHHVSFQPRTLREADTLAAAGFEVRVVTRQSDPELAERDARLAAESDWRLDAVDLSMRDRRWLSAKLEQRLARLAFAAGLRGPGVAVRSWIGGAGAFARLTAAEPADWYIAHTQAALPAAYAASRRHRARMGYDCEDLLALSGTEDPRLVRPIERAFVPRADYVSAPSKAIGAVLEDEHGIAPPTVLYNAFPRSLVDRVPRPSERPDHDRLRLYWFGQTLGPGRGLEVAAEALAQADARVELHLRGRVSESYRDHLRSLAGDAHERLIFLPTVDHPDLFATLGEFDVGLALEQPRNENYSRTVTNKVFAYLLGGLAIVATDTPGQREVLESASGAGRILSDGSASELAATLAPWAADRGALITAQEDAWQAARDRFCWDRQEEQFLALLAEDGPRGGRPR